MASTTAAGTKLAVSAGIPTAQTTTAYETLTYTTVGGVQSLGGFGAATQVVEFVPLDGPTEKYKGPTNYGQLQPTLKVDDGDAGQVLLQTYAQPTNIDQIAVRVTKPDGSLRFFQARVFGFPETIGEAASIITATPALEINTAVLKKAAPG